MKRIALAALAFGCLAAPAASAQETEDRDVLVRDLLSEDPGRVSSAIGRLPLVEDPRPGVWFKFREGQEVTAELAGALVAAYEHEKRLGSPNGELDMGLMAAIIATRHPLTIGILTRSLWGDFSAKEGLLYFGPSVLPGVVDLSLSPEATP